MPYLLIKDNQYALNESDAYSANNLNVQHTAQHGQALAVHGAEYEDFSNIAQTQKTLTVFNNAPFNLHYALSVPLSITQAGQVVVTPVL